MKAGITIPNYLDNKFIQMASESSTLNECLSLLTDKIDEIISPSDLTLDKLNKISALAKLIESYADKHNNLVIQTYMLVTCGKD